MAYIVGISSGIFGAAPQQERMQYLGISSKVNYCITQGVTFTQIDVETMSEFKDPKIGIEDPTKLAAWKNKIKSMNIAIGFHGESQAMGGRELPVKLDSAIEDDYVRTHDRLIETLDSAGKLGAKYYLLHSSESTPFILLGKDFQPLALVDVWGRKFRKFIEKENWIDDWIWLEGNGQFVWLTVLGRPLNDYLARYREDYENSEEFRTAIARGASREALLEQWSRRYKEELLRLFKGHIESRSLTYGAERYAYWIIAKWMEKNNDPLWERIAVKEWKRLQGQDKVSQEIKPTIEDKTFRESSDGISCWVPAVAAKYLWGHFNQEKCPDGDAPFKDKDPKKILEKHNLYFVIETPMASAGMENLMRLSDPVHMCILAEEIKFKYFSVALDFEHILSNYINPKEMIERMGETHGDLVNVLHLGWPTPIIPAHMPIYVGSEQHKWIYERLWELKQKGFTPDRDRYLIYERGSARIEQSILAMRLIVEFLEKNVEPKDLPPKFYGIVGPSPAVFERQRVIIQEHARDPIEGLLVVPEETHTFLGKAGIGKVGKEKWKKEELA